MKLRYFSHSAFQITCDDGLKILIDPFFDNNPTSPVKAEDVEADYILISHGHWDHLGDNFTMGIEDAAMACDFVKPVQAVPMHYNTFDVIRANPEDFCEKVSSNGIECKIMNFGDRITI